MDTPRDQISPTGYPPPYQLTTITPHERPATEPISLDALDMNSQDGYLDNNESQLQTSSHGQTSKDAVTQRFLGLPDLDVISDLDLLNCLRGTHLEDPYPRHSNRFDSTLGAPQTNSSPPETD